MGQTALHHSSRNGHKDVVRFLIAYAPHSIINMIDNEKGQTALHRAAMNKRRSISYMLVAGGSNLLIQDHAGKTPKILALEADDHDLAAYLESKSSQFTVPPAIVIHSLPFFSSYRSRAVPLLEVE